MRKPRPHAAPGNSSWTSPGPDESAIPVPAGLPVVIETSAKAKRGQRRKVKIDAVHETGLDALAKLLVHHLEPELKEILN